MNNKTTSEKKGWVIDLHNNFDWGEKVHADKKLPDVRISANFGFEDAPEFAGFWKLYGTEYEPCLVRFVLPNISTYEDCQRFIFSKFNKMLRHLETSISFLMEKTFNFKSVHGGPPTLKYLT
ncbi:MAG TPA: hypothetical protein VFJ43_12450, partial [Bacteroidia bacterium]|nr:hypothetical protein [Bacteroidia bacterium]